MYTTDGTLSNLLYAMYITDETLPNLLYKMYTTDGTLPSPFRFFVDHVRIRFPQLRIILFSHSETNSKI